MVERAPTGRGHTYWLLRDNVYVEEILDQAFLAERDIPDMMFAFIEEAMRESAVSVVLFGSYARGDQTVESDVDLVIVAGDEATKARLQAALETLAGTFRRRFGASLSALVYSREEAAAMRTRAPELFESVWHEGITVLGLDVDEWAIDANR